MRTAIGTGLVAGFFALTAQTASALPLLDGAALGRTTAPAIDQVYYRCGYYRCYHRRSYGYYRPYYRYGYYRPYYYRPHIGIGLGGIGIGLY